MGNHRADVVEPERRPSGEETPYVGRRAAPRAVEEPAPATPYVGRRALRPQPEPVLTPAPAQVVAPPVALIDVPAPRRTVDWNLFAPASVEDTGQLPYALTDDFTGSLPRIEADPGTDFSNDSTASLPLAKAGKRRARPARRTRIRVPSLPALLGVAALAVAGIGAVSSGHSDLVRAEVGPLRPAGALSGTSAVATVGTVQRGTSVSRDEDRTPAAAAATAESAAKEREAALAKLGKQIDGQSARLKLNQWQLPVVKGVYHLTAGFGDYGLWARAHTGLDFAAPVGTPIHAIANGVISSAQWDGAYGNKTVETLDDGTELWYAHQVRFGVKPGQEVHAGEVIGYVGATGHVTGPHVHIEVRPGGGDPVDPYPALVEQGLQP